MQDISQEQFNLAQNQLAAFLEDKYAIKNQSKGLIEYGAARVLGFENHHQLKAKLIKTQPLNYTEMNDDELFSAFCKLDATEDFITELYTTEGANIGDLTTFLKEEIQLDISDLSGEIIQKMLNFCNQTTRWEIRFYGDNDKLKDIEDYFYFHEVHERLGEILDVLTKKGSGNNIPKMTVRTSDGEEIDTIKFEDLGEYLNSTKHKLDF